MDYFDRLANSLCKIEHNYHLFMRDYYYKKHLSKKVKKNLYAIFALYALSLILSVIVFIVLANYIEKFDRMIGNALARILIVLVLAIFIVFIISTVLFKIAFSLFKRFTTNHEDEICYLIALQKCNYFLTFIIGTLLTTIIGLTSILYEYINISTENDDTRFFYKILLSGSLYIAFDIATILKLIISEELHSIENNSYTETKQDNKSSQQHNELISESRNSKN